MALLSSDKITDDAQIQTQSPLLVDGQDSSRELIVEIKFSVL